MEIFGKIARVDLSSKKISYEEVSQDLIQQTMGGVGLSAWFLLRDVPPSANWNDESNCVIFMSGPLGGTHLPGTGMVNVLSKGPMTNLAGSSQANGFFGAFLRLNGLLGIEIHGKSSEWVYVRINNGSVTIEDARLLEGLDTQETEKVLKHDLGRDISIACIGPAGENLVRFSAVMFDSGHAAAHNGTGAVMGSKKLKAVVVSRGLAPVVVADPELVKNLSKRFHQTLSEVEGGRFVKWGTLGAYEACYLKGQVAIKNLLTSVWPHYSNFTGPAIRKRYPGKPKPCWMCGVHGRWIEVPGLGQVDEPEYECMVAFGSLIDNPDVEGAIKLSTLVDRLGLDVNEAGWLVAWTMECYTNKLLTANDLNNLEMTWGNIESTSKLLEMVARRKGCGDWLAEGVMRAAEYTGVTAALSAAVGTKKGATLRTHDFRTKWGELLDTCVSTTSTIEAVAGHMNLKEMGIQPAKDPYDHKEIARVNAQMNGWRIFDDSCPICRFFSTNFPLLINGVNAVTGWSLSPQDALQIGKRTVNRLRVFNLLHGGSSELEEPSERCTRIPTDGPRAGLTATLNFKEMRQLYWREMGWDEATGKPLPKTLEDLGLNHECELLWE